MKGLKRKFMNMKIREKMVYSHIFIALIPFCLLGFIAIFISVNEEGKTVVQTTTQRVEQVQQTLDIYMDGIEKTVNMLIQSIDEKQLSQMQTEEDPNWEEMKTGIEKQFDLVGNTHDEIAGIFLATEHDLYVGMGMSRISRDSFLREDWYRKAMMNPRSMEVISNVAGRNIVTDETYSIDDVFSVVKSIVNDETGQVVGVLLLDIKYNTIASVIGESVIGEEGFAFVLDAQKKMMYAPENEVVYRIDPDWFCNSEDTLTASIDGQKYYISCRKSDYTGWRVVSVSSYQEVMQNAKQMFLIVVCVLVVTLTIVLLVAVKLSATITKPIVKLRNLMEKTEDGDLNVRFQGSDQDEISDLGRCFNRMLEQIQELVNAVYVEQEHKRKAQLQVVQEQFKPHFLYNTLDTIGWMAREYSADNIVKLVDALTNVFRISLSKGRDYISIAEEMKYISNYLYIQKIRYGPKVLYEMEMDETLAEVKIPKLILQPLVENAIYHGVKLKRGEGHLGIKVKKVEDHISMVVEDDGKGMAKEQVEKLTRLLNEPTSPEENQSFGLFYVKERLRMQYGEKFQVLVESEEGVGTKVTILIWEEEAEDGV